jgi:putative membrane-bound dehydrogenase-like protein
MRPFYLHPFFRFLVLLLSLCGGAAAWGQQPWPIGVARIDVTPAEPIRLTGYASRKTNSSGVEQRLWAKALALGSDADGPALLMTLDNCGIAEETYQELIERLGQKAGIRPDRLALFCSHTHCGPCTTRWAPNIFAQDIPPAHQATIDRYTRDLIDKLEQVALAALKDRRPGHLAWAQGSVGFARNRRVVAGATAQFGDNAAGPADQSLPVLRVTDADGKIRALVANYACHCTTLGGEFNQVCGDWAGYAQEAIERDNPGAIALITIGCGADANPSPRGGPDGGLALAKRHGAELGAEVKRLLTQTFTPLPPQVRTGLKHIELPFAPHFTRQQWEERAQKSGIVGYHAKKYLARLDRGEKLPATLSYYVQSWNFGDELALVFLSGEVVVDYALRLKKEFEATRLWVSGYANYVPCYIPSRRILSEGGYEAEDSLWYYDRPQRLAPQIEDLIIKTVHELLPPSFLFDKQKAEFPSAKTPEQALAAFRAPANFTVELVAAEPLVTSPVAIDWSSDGRLWVCEMYDYPSGLDENWKPGGRVKVLSSSQGDGHYDKAALFLDGLPFPTGLMAWRKGVLICAAPNILYAEDTDGDGRADLVRTNFAGFATHNYQARVSGLAWGLDGWVYGSSGLFGGKIRSQLTGKVVDLSGRDFRFQPDTGEIEAASGLSQQGRVQDDFGNWFGNDNSTLLWHFPLPDHYVRRNRHATYPDPRVNVAGARASGTDPNQLFPASRTLERFNDPQAANRTTSACGPEIYRDVLLGTNYYGNAFVCEPVHNLIHRLVLESDGVTYSGHRAAEEERSEFLASTDNWFRPVQVRTGPDGALWIVDMYRFVIEHPRWIPPERLKLLDARAGADQGRLYRIYPRGATLRPIRDLAKESLIELARALDTPNGPTRDSVHREFVWRRAEAAQRPATDPMARLQTHLTLITMTAHKSPTPAARAQALCVLGELAPLSPGFLTRALEQSQAGVRRTALRLSEPYLQKITGLQTVAFRLLDDPDPSVRFQLALSLGEWSDRAAGEMLGRLALAKDPWIRAAVLSSASAQPIAILNAVWTASPTTPGRSEMIGRLIATAAGSERSDALENALTLVAPRNQQIEVWQMEAVTSLLEALDRKGLSLESSLFEKNQELREAHHNLERTLLFAQLQAQNKEAEEGEREAAIRLLGAKAPAGFERLRSLLQLPLSPRLQHAVVNALGRRHDPQVAESLLAEWNQFPPGVRTAVLRLLLTRDDWVTALLTAVDKSVVAPSEVPLPSRQRLLKHDNSAIRERAQTLFASTSSDSRAAVLAKYQGVSSLTGVSERGAAHFEKNCALCHSFRGQGHAVGPNLAEFAGKSVADFLVAILDPNAAIEPKFLAYTIETRDGRSLSGVVKGETASSLTLVQGGGLEEKILRSDIREMRAGPISLMPEGLEQNMAPQDLADLIAWFKQSAPAPMGSANAEKAAKARAEFMKGGMNGLAKVLASVEPLPYPSWLGRLTMPYCRQNGSTLAWQTFPVPTTLAHESTYRFRLAAAMGFLSQPSGQFTLHCNGRLVLDFDVALSDQTWQSADGQVRMTYSVMENNSEDSDGVLVIEVAASLLQPGKPVDFKVTGSAANSQRWFGVYVLPVDATASVRR